MLSNNLTNLEPLVITPIGESSVERDTPGIHLLPVSFPNAPISFLSSQTSLSSTQPTQHQFTMSTTPNQSMLHQTTTQQTTTAHQKEKLVKRQYTEQENLNILEYVKQYGQSSGSPGSPGGNSLWKEMEMKKVRHLNINPRKHFSLCEFQFFTVFYFRRRLHHIRGSPCVIII